VSNTEAKQPDDLGALKWLLLAGVFLYALASLLAWPFRSIAEHWPGRREKFLRVAIDEINNSIPNARQLVRVLGAGVEGIEAKLEKGIGKIEKKIQRLESEKGWAKDLNGDNPWSIAIDILEKAKRIRGIDWRSDTDELKKAMGPLLSRHELTFDWSFLNDLERNGQFETLKNENLLPFISARLSAIGHILVHVDDGSDNYLLALCTPEVFGQIESLSNGAYSVRRFSHDDPRV
jgi:hypothetical protein